MAQIEKKTDFEGGGGNAENNIIDQIKRRLNVILFGVVKPEDDRRAELVLNPRRFHANFPVKSFV